MGAYPAYKGLITISAGVNDKVHWYEDDQGGNTYSLSITLTAGSYYPSTLASTISSAMEAESDSSGLGLHYGATGVAYAVGIDDDTGVVTITASHGSCDAIWYPKITTTETAKFLTGGDQSVGERGDRHFGWVVDSSYPASSVSHSSDVAHSNAWYPTQGKLSDNDGNRQNAVIESTSIGGATTTYSFGPATRGSDPTRTRSQSFEELSQADRDQYEDEFWHPFAKTGGVFRYFNDRTDTSTYSLYRLTGESLKTPNWSRTRSTLSKWNLSLELRRSS